MALIEYDAIVQVFLIIGVCMVLYRQIQLEKKFSRFLRLMKS
jgi:hypothetical protein